MTDDSTMQSREARGPAYGPGWTNAATLVDGSETPRERLGRYELLRPLGAGGMGEVFLADLCGPHGFRKRVAIKRLRPSFEGDPVEVTRFAREAQLAARLVHPAICQTFELGYDGGAHYIAMEYLDGTTLGRVLTQLRATGTALPLPVVVRIIDRICAGLAAAHALKDDDGAVLGLVHRDVSPSNIAITRGGEIKLLDFGVAKVEQVRTQTGILRGKFGYMSPEQITNQPIDRRTDVFAVGVVLYEALTGRRLFGHSEPRACADAILHGEVPDVRALRPDVPAAVADVLTRALARRHGARFASAELLRRALLAAIAPVTPAGPRVLAQLATWSADPRGGDAPTMVALALPRRTPMGTPPPAPPDDDPTEIIRAAPEPPPPWRDLPELPAVRFTTADAYPDEPPRAPGEARFEPTVPVVALPYERTASVSPMDDRARLIRLAVIVAIATALGAILMSALC